MTVTTALIGKLGGGIETQTVEITKPAYVHIPSGWRKAHGVFEGTATSTSPYIFNTRGTATQGQSVNGGGVLSTGQGTTFTGVTGIITWYRVE